MRFTFIILICTALMACGPMTPEEQKTEVASQQRKLDLSVITQCAAGVTTSCISGAYGTVKDIVDTGKTVLGWLGLDLGGSGPTTQDVLNRIGQLANQNEEIRKDIQSAHLLVQDVITRIGALQATSLNLYVLGQTSRVDGLLSGLGEYAYEVQQHQTPSAVSLIQDSRTLTAALSDPILFRDANGKFTPSFAVPAAVRAITVRLLVLQTVHPNRFLIGQVS